MKTFEDLKFEQHPVMTGIMAKMSFDNGYGISVIKGPNFYCDRYTYEVAILKDNEICYESPLTDDVLGYQTKEDISNIMEQIQSWSKDQY